jgi:hypothetical protein
VDRLPEVEEEVGRDQAEEEVVCQSAALVVLAVLVVLLVLLVLVLVVLIVLLLQAALEGMGGEALQLFSRRLEALPAEEEEALVSEEDRAQE